MRELSLTANAPLANAFYNAVTAQPASDLIEPFHPIDPPAPPVKPTLHEAFTEQIFYADAAKPRYTGEMGARKTTLGGRYDYSFDAHDRLVAAAYTPAATADPDEDFSTRYGYDAIGRPTFMLRKGVVTFENGAERFGILDDVQYSYTGAVLSEISGGEKIINTYDGVNSSVGLYQFNDAGGLIFDTSRNITDITYNHLGQPLSTTVFDPRLPYLAANTYTSQGTLSAWKHSRSGVAASIEECSKLGNFDYRKKGLAKFQLERADFAFGYFDGSGVHWTLKDAIGSIELVVSGDGRVEQHTGYYPYGQPWRAVAGQQRLFGDKELRTFAGLNDYDFHARFQNPAGPFFQSADRHAANDPARSPYTFAAANPIRFTDPTGLDTTDTAADSTGTAPTVIVVAENAQIVSDSFNSASGIKMGVVQYGANSATGQTGEEALRTIGGEGLVGYSRFFEFCTWLGLGITTFSVGSVGYEYINNGGDDPKVIIKLAADEAASFIPARWPNMWTAGGAAIYFIISIATDGFQQNKKIEEQRIKAQEQKNKQEE